MVRDAVDDTSKAFRTSHYVLRANERHHARASSHVASMALLKRNLLAHQHYGGRTD
jgi:hypothetical protein